MKIRWKCLTGCLTTALALMAGAQTLFAEEIETGRDLLSWTLLAGRAGEPGQLAVQLRGQENATLDAWLDFDGDGFFNEAEERILDRAAIEPGMSIKGFELPPEAALSASSRIRFRLNGLAGETRMEREALAFPERVVDPGCSWAPGFGTDGLNEDVYAFEVFDDFLYVGGYFDEVEGAASPRSARWDGRSWQVLSGLEQGNGIVRALESFDDGNGRRLYAGADFAPYLFRLNGTAWEAVQGINGGVKALAAWETEDERTLYIGGSFLDAGGLAGGDRIVAFQGDGDFEALGSGRPTEVLSLRVFDLGAGSLLYVAAGTSVASWNGQAWQSLGNPGNSGQVVNSLERFGATLYAGGGFGVKSWNGGTSWSAVASLEGVVYSLKVFDDGQGPALYAGGADLELDDGPYLGKLARWNGSGSWTGLARGMNNQIFALETYAERTGAAPALFAGGSFGETNSLPSGENNDLDSNFIVRFDAGGFSTLSSGISGYLMTLEADPARNQIYAGGEFTMAGRLAVSNFARWDDRWHDLYGGTPPWPRDILIDSGTSPETIYVASQGDDSGSVRKLQGAQWTDLTTSINNDARALAIYGGRLYMGGSYSSIQPRVGNPQFLASWNGTNWSVVGANSPINNEVNALTVFNFGSGPERLVVGGVFGERVAVWNGSQWSTLAGLPNVVYALAVHDNHDGLGPQLYAGGNGFVARWTGTQWQIFGVVVGEARALQSFSDGTRQLLAVGGQFSRIGTLFYNHFAIWDGQEWNGVGSGFTGNNVLALATLPTLTGDRLFAGGRFTTVNGLSAAAIARLECPAPIVDFDAAITMSSTPSSGSTVSIGDEIRYDIVVTNAGPATATSLEVRDALSAELGSCSWMAAGTPGASGQQDGVGNLLHQTLTLEPGAQVSYAVSCRVAAAAEGSLANVATLTAALDTNPANDQAQVSHTVRPPLVDFDAVVTMTSPSTIVSMGDLVVYQIEVRNDGPTAATALKILDVFPATLVQCGWSAESDDGATGQGNGSGNELLQTLHLPPNARVTYDITCRFAGSDEGILENHASLTPADLVPANSHAMVSHVVHPDGEVPGDCSDDNVVDARDFDAFHSEIFDGDGHYPEFTPAGSFVGHPIGCNANLDGTVDAGDLSCLTRMLQGQACLIDALPAPGLPRLSMPDLVLAANRQIRVPISLDPAQQGINTVAFELHYESSKVELATGPSAIVFHGVAAQATIHQRVDRGNHLIEVVIRRPLGEQLANGLLATLTFNVDPSHLGGIVQRAVTFSTRTSASFGNTKGQGVVGLATLHHSVVDTLVVTNTSRLFAQSDLGFGIDQQLELRGTLESFLNHDRVQGMLVDLSADPDLRRLYQQWDSGQPDRANAVLFGGDGRRGLHTLLLQLQQAFPDVKHLLLIGDDRIVPFARLRDTGELSERDYVGAINGSSVAGLPAANPSTVKKALAADYFLSDDPLASQEPLSANALEHTSTFVLPGLGVGRLVENAAEILGALDNFLQRDGLLDLQTFGPGQHQVAVAGYDFSIDSAVGIADRWRAAFAGAPQSSTPVDDDLIGNLWHDDDLLATLAEGRTRIFSLNGHASHELVGSPRGAVVGAARGLPALDLYGEDQCGNGSSTERVDLGGAVVIGMSCHGGLTVPGTCADAGSSATSHTLDLAQTFLASGALAYGDNSGFGWGLLEGTGLGERLALLIHEGMAASRYPNNPKILGTILRQAKLDYYLRQLDFDIYDRKSLMQWTLYGFPMVELALAQDPGAGGDSPELGFGPPDGNGWSRALRGDMLFERREGGEVPLSEPLPPHLTPWEMNVTFPPGDYHRVELGSTDDLPDTSPCPEAGCYWQLTGLSTDEVDLPMQPFLTFKSTLVARVQRGVLWKGAGYTVETPFYPVVATPISSVPVPASGIEPLPIRVYQQPTGPNGGGYLGGPMGCPQSSGSQSQVVVLTGELKQLGEGSGVWEGRRYGNVELEILYHSQSASDCMPPVFDGDGAFDHVDKGGNLHWHVPVTDKESGIWRVIAVWDDELAQAWKSVDLVRNGDVWEGTLPFDPQRESVTYFLQAVDREGNVAWWERTEKLPLVTRQLPEPIFRETLPTLPPKPTLFADGFESGDCSAWGVNSPGGC